MVGRRALTSFLVTSAVVSAGCGAAPSTSPTPQHPGPPPRPPAAGIAIGPATRLSWGHGGVVERLHITVDNPGSLPLTASVGVSVVRRGGPDPLFALCTISGIRRADRVIPGLGTATVAARSSETLTPTVACPSEPPVPGAPQRDSGIQVVVQAGSGSAVRGIAE